MRPTLVKAKPEVLLGTHCHSSGIRRGNPNRRIFYGDAICAAAVQLLSREPVNFWIRLAFHKLLT